jgi:MYXO-CTERM domain-containing protein
MTTNVRFPLFALLLVSAGCGPGFDAAAPDAAEDDSELQATSNEIVGGKIEEGHPAVAMLYHSSGYLCTGTLIDKRVFLTAAHCIESLSATGYEVDGGTRAWDSPEWIIKASSVHRHPQYNEQSLDHDIGIVILKSDAPVKPYRWLSTNDDDIYKPGTEFQGVGYGITSGNGAGDGTKRAVGLEISEVYTGLFVYESGPNGANSCSGDSGGPGLAEIDGYHTVIGTVSFGDQYCQQYGADMRTNANRSFIEDYAAPDAGTAKVAGSDDGGSKDPVACSVSSVRTGSPLAAALLALVAGLAVSRRRHA